MVGRLVSPLPLGTKMAAARPLEVNVELPSAFKCLRTPSRYKALYGGRGSGKSHSVASQLILFAVERPIRVLCCREIQRSIKDSVRQLLVDKINAMGLASFFKITENELVGVNGSRFFFAGLRSNPESIKSFEGINIAWIEEASTVSKTSMELLIPTIRQDGSEIWATWNPGSEYDYIDQFFRGKNPPPPNVAIIKAVTYADNPWFPAVLREEMERDRQTDPEKYAHVWQGSYRAAASGSYYGKAIARAQHEGRIGVVPHDPNATVHVSLDLGVGAHMALIFSQWIGGGDVRFIDTLEGDEEAANAGLPWYAARLRERPYNYAPLLLPHDARVRDLGTGKSREEILIKLGFKTQIVPDIGVEAGIEACKRILGMARFDAVKCAPLLKPLREYREDYDHDRRLSKGPFKDWTNHFADSFRYTAVGHAEPKTPATAKKHHGGNSGMGWLG